MNFETYEKLIAELQKRADSKKAKELLAIMHLAVDINNKSLFDMVAEEYNTLVGEEK